MKKQQFHCSDTLIIIFAREPVPGQVKTRLIPALGETGATLLYKRLLDSIMNTITASGLAAINLCITPESSMNYFAEMCAKNNFELSVQTGNDLGVRMYNALAKALERYAKAVLIGTDCPFLTAADLQQAIIALNNNDLVFSPAKDGGYVLVGASRAIKLPFQQIDWGTEQVMSQTRRNLLQHNISWQELPEHYDIDTPDDLKQLALHRDFKGLIPLLE